MKTTHQCMIRYCIGTSWFDRDQLFNLGKPIYRPWVCQSKPSSSHCQTPNDLQNKDLPKLDSNPKLFITLKSTVN